MFKRNSRRHIVVSGPKNLHKIHSATKSGIKKTFLNYGHDCTLEGISDDYDIEYAPGDSLLARFRRWLVRMRVVSETSKLYTHHLRSFGAISAERRRQLKFYPYAIHPFSLGRIVWAGIMMVVILYQFVITSFLYILFDFRDPNFSFDPILNIFRLFFDSFLILNVLMNFFTGFYDEPMQKVMLDFPSIFKHYLRTNLIPDVLSSFPTYVDIFYKMNTKQMAIILWITIFRFLLIRTFTAYSKILANYFQINHFNYMTAMVIVYTILFWHVMCCVIEFIRSNIVYYNRFEAFYDTSETGYHLNDVAWIKYINSLHHKSLLLYNSGYGKTIPKTELEIILIYFVWYGSSLFCIYILAMIMEINTGKTSSALKYDAMERQLKEYMRHKQLPTQMRARILTYYEFKFQKKYFRENEILSTISEQLRQEMNMHACKKLVENVTFFRNLPLNLLVRIISCLKIEVFLVNDVIIRANTPGVSMYFISTGTVAIYTKSGKEVCHLEDGAHFGEIALLIKNTFRIASVVAVEVSEIYRLDQKDFVKAINPYPDLLANIQHIAEERMEVTSMLDEYNKREITSQRRDIL
ncbi:potassium/sodium hyperpolarization-activated cyclic nucleotide-gated channel 2-like [Diorhabda carinulata]|uniref:potassium/sodium hyperpolarization-activated cyclic nucleotide-gated channel 2-like n=1 Tax=Diorhabda carinulata TaxID=1163345 RepID=UPI00259FF12B|nr:potassium/sodium hyperpolarization-activated cyclic nucleotide-gated channel 2-like [Diorhabda carinulata]XP_057672251.1 potassium/sodium hyperpolarization-activated cyclic nucleotide-gated channel 2-like [Diorhabda carinulata]